MLTVILKTKNHGATIFDGSDFDEVRRTPEDMAAAMIETLRTELVFRFRCRCGDVAGDDCDAWGEAACRYVEKSDHETHQKAPVWRNGWINWACLDALETAGLDEFVEVLDEDEDEDEDEKIICQNCNTPYDNVIGCDCAG